MAQAVLLTCFTFLLSVAVAFLVAIITLHYQRRALRLEQSKQKQNLAEEIKRGINERLIPVAISAIILAGILLVWFWLSLLRAPAG
jgi:Cu/Ag efflux pump CusA